MTKKILVVILAVVAVVLLADVVYIGTLLFAGNKNPVPEVATDGNGTISLYNPYNNSNTQPTQSDTLASPYNMPTTLPVYPATQPSLQNQVTDPTGNATAPTGTAPTEQPIQVQPDTYTLEQTVTQMQNAVAYLKNAKNFTGYKKQVPSIRITYLSISWIQSAAQGIISQFADPVEYTYVFKNGVADDPKTDALDYTVTPAAVIPPASKAFVVDLNGITGYNVTKNADGSITYTVGIKEESCDVSQAPTYHASCMDYINLNDYDISPAKIHSGTVTYHEATVSVTVNADGLPIAMREYMPVTGSGEGSLLGVTAQATVTGSLDETWTFVW